MIPVVIGVADIKNGSTAVEDAKEPADLMIEAIQLALNDATGSPDLGEMLQSQIDSINVVRTWTWPYSDLPGLLEQRLRVQARHCEYSDNGDNQPAKMLDQLSRRISTGESTVGVITGAEALASLASCVKQKAAPPGWTLPAESPTWLTLLDLGGLHSIGAPIHIYPLYENGFRAHRGQTIKANHEESTLLYESFNKIAASNPYAWNAGKTEISASIGTVSKKDRVICFPCPLLMNAFNTVNLGAACIVTSTEVARQLQIPQEKWVYPLGGASFKERDLFWERPNFFHSSAISNSLDQCLALSGLHNEDIDVYDFYSCFPIVPKLAAHHLGLSTTAPPKPITVLGGLTSFGGAGNNYSMHAITEMTRRMRSGHARNGLILANGGFLSYQHAICMSKEPRRNNTPYPDNQALNSESSPPVPPIESEANGQAEIEVMSPFKKLEIDRSSVQTYTVEFNRDGNPRQAYIVGRLLEGRHRFLASHGDDETLRQMSSSSEEPIGRTGWVMTEMGEAGQRRNLFYFDSQARL